MKHKLLALILFSTIYSYTFSQVRVTGKIVDQLQNAIPGATVSFMHENRKEGVTADQSGIFLMELSQPGVYDVEIRSLGFDPYITTYTFSENKLYDLGAIVLTTYTQELQTVEVIGRADPDYNSEYSFSATKTAIRNKDLPQALSTVTKELIADRQAFQLADAVKIVSGVTPSSFYNQYNIRGISQNEEGQIVNGMRTRQYYFLQPITTNI